MDTADLYEPLLLTLFSKNLGDTDDALSLNYR